MSLGSKEVGTASGGGLSGVWNWWYQLTRRRWFAAAATMLAAALVLLSRAPDRLLRPQFWAEDAIIFFLEADVLGVKSILTPAAGYIMLVPRLVALMATWFDPAWAPAIYVYSVLAAALFVVGRMFSPRLNLPFKPLLGTAIAALPQNGEIILASNNGQWYISILLVQQLLMRDPMTRGEKVRDGIITGVAAFTGPFSLLLLPCFLLRAWLKRNSGAYLVAGIVTFAAAVQAGPILVAALEHNTQSQTSPGFGGLAPLNDFRLDRTRPSAAFGGWTATFSVLSRRLVFYSFFGRGLPLGQYGRSAYALVGLVFLVGLFLLACRPSVLREAKLWMWAVGLLFMVGTMVRVRLDTMDFYDVLGNDRYFFVPRLLFVWLVILQLAADVTLGWRSVEVGGRKGWRLHVEATAGATVIAAVLAGGFLANYPDNYRVPPYIDLHWDAYSQKLRDGEPVDIPINPGWTLHHPGRRCSDALVYSGL